MARAGRGDLFCEVDRLDVFHFTPCGHLQTFHAFQAAGKLSKPVLIVDSLTGDAEQNLRDG